MGGGIVTCWGVGAGRLALGVTSLRSVELRLSVKKRKPIVVNDIVTVLKYRNLPSKHLPYPLLLTPPKRLASECGKVVGGGGAPKLLHVLCMKYGSQKQCVQKWP